MTGEGEEGETGEEREVTEMTDEEVERLLGSYGVNATDSAGTRGDQHHPPEINRAQASAAAE